NCLFITILQWFWVANQKVALAFRPQQQPPNLCHPERLRRSFATEEESKDPGAASDNHAASGSSLKTPLNNAIKEKKTPDQKRCSATQKSRTKRPYTGNGFG